MEDNLILTSEPCCNTAPACEVEPACEAPACDMGGQLQPTEPIEQQSSVEEERHLRFVK